MELIKLALVLAGGSSITGGGGGCVSETVWFTTACDKDHYFISLLLTFDFAVFSSISSVVTPACSISNEIYALSSIKTRFELPNNHR